MFPRNSGVLALTSDASVDFTPEDFNAPLTPAQRAYLKTKTGLDLPRVFWRQQVHGDRVLVAEGKPEGCRSYPPADAFVTHQKGLALAIRTADCVPVFIFDPVQKVIGLAHAGWKGARQQIAAKTVKTMQDKFGCRCYDLTVMFGPAIRSCCYQVGVEFKEHFPEHVSARAGKLYFDMCGALRRQMRQAGVPDQNISDREVCTCCGQNCFSFRRDGAKAGRMISLMVLI